MAWVDDRIWCHPKFTDLSPEAFRAYVQGLAYCSGMNTRGTLTLAQQELVGGTLEVRQELIDSNLWNTTRTGPRKSTVKVHDWDDYNGRRDERKEADRDRKRAARAKTSAGQSTPNTRGTSSGLSTGRTATSAHVDGSDGSEGKTLPTPTASRDADNEARIAAILAQGEPEEIPA